jgi:hypothetical protein
VDWEIFRERMTWAYEQGVDTLPIGDAMVTIGRRFVGTPYEPHTLEIEGPERLVLNFEALDCVTFVENVLAMARFARTATAAILAEEHRYQAQYREILSNIRYRGGEVDGYPSRLHYFSEWIADGEAKGLVQSMARELGGEADAEPIDFMSSHPDAYRQLADPLVLDAIRQSEERISAKARYYVPEGRIPEAAGGIRDGDIIAATSTVDGLDVAHTGIAVWLDGALHLMHAPLVGDSVEISRRSLADRILEIGSQDGIMVARPLDLESG